MLKLVTKTSLAPLAVGCVIKDVTNIKEILISTSGVTTPYFKPGTEEIFKGTDTHHAAEEIYIYYELGSKGDG